MPSRSSVELLEARRLFTALVPGAATELVTGLSAQDAAVRDDGSVVVVSRGTDGSLSLRSFSAAGEPLAGPAPVSGSGSAVEGVGSDSRPLDTDRDGRVSVVYRRAGQVFVRAFAADLSPLGTEFALGTLTPLDLAVSASGYLIPTTTVTSLGLQRVSFAGADLGSSVVSAVTRPRENERYDFDSVSVDTDAAGGFVVGWSANTVLTNTLTRRLRGGDIVESETFDDFRSGGFFVRRFLPTGAAAAPAVAVLPRRNLAETEIEIAVAPGGAVSLVTATLNNVLTRPVFDVATSSFSAVTVAPASSVIQSVSLANSRGRLALAGRPITLFSGALPDGQTSLSFAGGGLQVDVASTGLTAVSADLRPFARSGADLTVDLEAAGSTLVRQFSAAGAPTSDVLSLSNSSPSSLSVTSAGDIQLATVSGTSVSGRAFVQTLVAPKPSIVPTAPGPLRAVSGRTLPVTLSLLNSGPVAAAGSASVSALLRREGFQDVALTTPTGRPLALVPGRSARLAVTFRLPIGLAAGQYTLLLTLDPASQLPDGNRADNTVQTALTIR